MRTILFITGTDTGVGKTIFTAALTRHLRARGRNAVALKPLCSGGREDARQLHAANDGALTLDEINPWHFRAALAPVLAARREHQRITLPPVLAHVRRLARRFEVVLVEGAGGLLSPLGEGFDNRDLLRQLRATPIILVPNRLGAVGQARLTLAALPPRAAARIVLVEQAKPDRAARTNAALLAEFAPGHLILRWPWLGASPRRPIAPPDVRTTDGRLPAFAARCDGVLSHCVESLFSTTSTRASKSFRHSGATMQSQSSCA